MNVCRNGFRYQAILRPVDCEQRNTDLMRIIIWMIECSHLLLLLFTLPLRVCTPYIANLPDNGIAICKVNMGRKLTVPSPAYI